MSATPNLVKVLKFCFPGGQGYGASGPSWAVRADFLLCLLGLWERTHCTVTAACVGCQNGWKQGTRSPASPAAAAQSPWRTDFCSPPPPTDSSAKVGADPSLHPSLPVVGSPVSPTTCQSWTSQWMCLLKPPPCLFRESHRPGSCIWCGPAAKSLLVTLSSMAFLHISLWLLSLYIFA